MSSRKLCIWATWPNISQFWKSQSSLSHNFHIVLKGQLTDFWRYWILKRPVGNRECCLLCWVGPGQHLANSIFRVFSLVAFVPDRPSLNFWASRSGDWWNLSHLGTSCVVFWSSKVVKGSVGKQLHARKNSRRLLLVDEANKTSGSSLKLFLFSFFLCFFHFFLSLFYPTSLFPTFFPSFIPSSMSS